MDFLAVDRYIKENLNNFRYEHTLRVVDMGMILCNKLSYCDEEKVKIACYFHDVGKNLPEDTILNMTLNEGYELNEYELKNIHIFHGVASMVIARDKFNVDDIQILNAIKNHVTGAEDMSIIDKIVFLADFFEMGRNFERVYKSRDAALIDLDLDKSMLFAYNSIIVELLEKGGFIHENTIKARNFILKNL